MFNDPSVPNRTDAPASGDLIPIRQSLDFNIDVGQAQHLRGGQPTPEDIARAYIKEHGSFYGWEDTRQWKTTVKIVIIVVVLAIVATGAAIGVVKGGVLHRNTSTQSSANVVTPPLVDVVQNLPQSEVTFNVHLSSFSVKVVAYGGATSVTQGGSVSALAQQGDDQVFTVTHDLTIVTANSSARVAIYDKLKLIGFYFPTVGPFTLTFHALGRK
jgi:hypothetical protein